MHTSPSPDQHTHRPTPTPTRLQAWPCNNTTLHMRRPTLGPGCLVLVQGATVKKHGVAEFGQACVTARHVPRNTCCRHKGLHDYKRVSSRLAYTAEHKSTWNYSYTNTLTPIFVPAAYKPPSLLDWNRKNDGSQKRPKSAVTRGLRVCTSPCEDKRGGRLYEL